MMGDEGGETRGIAQLKALLSQDYAGMVMDFINDLRTGKDVDYDRFWEMMRGMHDIDAVRGWGETLLWCEERDGEVLTTDDGRKLRRNLHPAKNKKIRNKFITDLLMEINMKLTEAKDMVTGIGYLRGPRKFRGGTPESVLTDIYESMARRRKR